MNNMIWQEFVTDVARNINFIATLFAFVSLAQVFWPVEEDCQKTVINVVRKVLKSCETNGHEC